MDGVAVQGVLLELGGEVGGDLHGDVVHPVVVVAVLGEVALHLKVHGDAVLVADGPHLGKLDGGQRVGGNGQTRHAEGGQALHQGVVEGHLTGLVGVLVVHVVDDVDGVHVQLSHVGQNLLVVGEHLGVAEHLVLVPDDAGHHVEALLLVHTAVDGVQQALGQVGPGAEELHLLAHGHGGHTAGDAVVVPVQGAHHVVVLVLDGVGGDAHLGAVVLPGLGQVLAPQHGEVGLGSGAQVGEGVEVAEAVAGHQGAAVNAHAAQGLGDPGGIAAEQLVVLGGTQVTHQAQLDDELVNELLGPLLVQQATVQVPLDVDVQEGGGAAQRGGGAVVLLHARQVGQVQVLHGLMGVLGGTGDVAAVAAGHVGELLEGPNLGAHFLPQADALLGHGAVQLLQVLLLLLNEEIGAVQGHPAVVAHQTATAIGIGQTGEQASGTGQTGALGVGVKHALVVGLAVEAEVALDLGVQLVAVLVEGGLGHAHAAVQVDNALEGGVGLETHNDLVFLVNVAGLEVVDTGYHMGLHVDDALFQLLHNEGVGLLPHLGGAGGDGGQEAVISGIGGVVLLNEVAHIHQVAPFAGAKALPGGAVDINAHGNVPPYQIWENARSNFSCHPARASLARGSTPSRG